ncbi:MAG: insulinase family protein [Rhodospirillales bacterium]
MSGDSVTLQTTRENLAPVLKLIAEIMREPSFPQSEFDQLKRASLASIERQRNEPDALAGNALSRHLAPYPRENVRYVQTFDESLADLQKLDLAAVRKFYGRFYGMTAAEVAVVGDFDAPETKKEIEDLFGNWVTPQRYARIADEFIAVPAKSQVIETPDKANATVVAAEPLNLSENDPDYPALAVANYIFGGSQDSRLFKRIREQEGLSYGVRSGVTASFFDRAGRFSFTAIAAPQNIARVETAFLDEVARARADGFAEAEVENAKAGLLRAREVARTNDDNLTFVLATLMHQDIWMKDRMEFERKIARAQAGRNQRGVPPPYRPGENQFCERGGLPQEDRVQVGAGVRLAAASAAS